MAGRPEGTTVRDVIVTFRLTRSGEEALDKLRGDRSRSRYLRDLLLTEAKKR